MRAENKNLVQVGSTSVKTQLGQDIFNFRF